MNDDHPVWDVYSEYRTARLNVLYYSAILARLRARNFWIELALAAAAPTSSVAGLAFWTTGMGAIVWQVSGGVAAFLAVVKPLMKLTEKIAKLEEIVAGYRALDHDLRRLEIKIHQDRAYGDVHRTELEAALEKKRELITQERMFEKEDKRLKDHCDAEVLRALPTDSFYEPDESS